ncbi:MAG: response regulator, partial [Verrucomicrobiota bacterium]
KRIDAEFLFSRSTDRLSRQTEIRRLVSSATTRPNVSALARQFRVARRTIIRDLQELIRRGELSPEVFPKWDQAEGEVQSD